MPIAVDEVPSPVLGLKSITKTFTTLSAEHFDLAQSKACAVNAVPTSDPISFLVTPPDGNSLRSYPDGQAGIPAIT